MSAATPPRLPFLIFIGTGITIFLANAGLLVLQLVAGRYLAPFIGSSVETWTSIIGVFLAGIAVGNWLGGWLADRYPTTRMLSILLFCGSLLSLGMMGAADLAYRTGFYRSLPLTPRIPLMTFLFCFAPAVALSLITPLTIKLALPDVTKAGRIAGLIFALSTLGCLLGNYLTGFVLMADYTLNQISWGVALSLLVLAVVMALSGYRAPTQSSIIAVRPSEEATSVPWNDALDFRGKIHLAYIVVFIASFCGMSLELTASRILAPILGVSLYTWTGVIGVMLAGTALGNASGGLLADWANRGSRNATSILSASLFLAAMMTLGVLLLRGIFAHSAYMLTGHDVFTKILLWTFGMFFVPMFLLGTISPQVIRLSVTDMQHAGRVAGSIYAWSTVGAIVGTFVTGYFLISVTGTFRVVLFLAFTLNVLAFCVGRLWKYHATLYAASVLSGGAIFGLIAIGYGTEMYDLETKYYAIKVRPLDEYDREDLGIEEGTRPNCRKLALDYLVHSYVDLDDPNWLGYKHEEVQGELLRLAASREEKPKLLVIGGGGYTFPRWVEHNLPQVEVDVVEIDPGVTEIAHRMLGFRRDTKIRSHHMDGRQFVSERAGKGHYQLVMQDAVNDLSVPYHLMTKEYNEAVKACLTHDGAYLLTLIDSLATGELWRAAVHTLRESFPHVVILSPQTFSDIENRKVYVIYASQVPLDLERLTQVVMNESINDFIPAFWVFPLIPPYTHITMLPGYWLHRRWTQILPESRLEDLLKQRRKIVLTDQYAPVDNLMSEVFRARERSR